MGAWIETRRTPRKATPPGVAPRVGAWIETPICWFGLCPMMSHPVWVRGLKLAHRYTPSRDVMSHPVWVRGLKLTALIAVIVLLVVAPRVGAWIETLVRTLQKKEIRVAPRVGAWIETYLCSTKVTNQISRTPCGCVD